MPANEQSKMCMATTNVINQQRINCNCQIERCISSKCLNYNYPMPILIKVLRCRRPRIEETKFFHEGDFVVNKLAISLT